MDLSAVHSEEVIDQSDTLAALRQNSNVGVRTSPLATVAFLCSAIGLGLLLGTGPVGVFMAPIGVLLGLVAFVRSRAGGRRGLAIAAIVIGTIVTLLSLAMILESQAT